MRPWIEESTGRSMVCFVLLGLAFCLVPAVTHSAILDSYIGLSGAKINYYQKDKSGGETDWESWKLQGYEIRNGTRLTSWIIFETRFGSSEKETKTFLGKKESAKVKRYYGALLKIRPSYFDLSPYLLGGTTTGAIETCRDVCSEGFFSEMSYGAGIDYRIFESSSIYIEKFHLGDSKSDYPKESLNSINIGINITGDELSTFGKWLGKILKM